jgi:hypothetical protein
VSAAKLVKMSNFLPKLELSNGENPAEQWSVWLNIYLVATEINLKDEKIQIAQLLHYGGPELQKIYATFTFAEGERERESGCRQI